MDTSAKEITFSKMGVCNFCALYKQMDWQRVTHAGELKDIISDIKAYGRDKQYDCILGLSGGVDSSWALHLIREAGLRPYCFTVDNGWNTPKANENIMRLVEILKVPFYRYTIDIERFKKLQQTFIDSKTANVEIPTDHILFATTYEMAAKNGLKYIISGGNIATEGVMPESWGYNARDLRFLKAVFRKHKKDGDIKGLPTLSLMKYLYYRFIKGIKIINILDYYNYNKQETKLKLQELYGWKDYGEKHEESVFTKWFQDEYLPYFGIDKNRAHFSSLINSKQMTRQEALDKLKPIQKREDPTPHTNYANSEKIWSFLSKIYGIAKR